MSLSTDYLQFVQFFKLPYCSYVLTVFYIILWSLVATTISVDIQTFLMQNRQL